MVAGETIILANFIGVFIFAYLAMNTSDEHAPLRLFYHLLTFFWFFASLGMSVNTISNGGMTRGIILEMMNSFSWAIWLVLAYFFIYLLHKALQDLGKVK